MPKNETEVYEPDNGASEDEKALWADVAEMEKGDENAGPWDEGARCTKCGAEQRGGFDRLDGANVCRDCLRRLFGGIS